MSFSISSSSPLATPATWETTPTDFYENLLSSSPSADPSKGREPGGHSGEWRSWGVVFFAALVCDNPFRESPDTRKEVEAYLEFDPDMFRGKVVYCNCDDPFESNFFKYFAANFNKLGL